MHKKILDKKHKINILVVISIIGLFLYIRQPLIYVIRYIPTVEINRSNDIGRTKKLINTFLKEVEFIDKDGNKKNNIKEELDTLKKYIVGKEQAREIIRIQFGANKNINQYIKENSKTLKTNIEGISSIYSDYENKELNESNTVKYGKIEITNETRYNIDIEKLRNEPLEKKFKKDTKILIYHTHTNESYISSIKDLNNMSILPRSGNEEINVIRVGKELKNNLLDMNISAIHDKKYHNLQTDKGAYAKSYNTVIEHIKNEPNIDITLDLHRDGISDKKKLRLVTDIDNKKVAKIMFVVGTNASGLDHPKWQENLKFALRLQEKLIKYNTNLVKPIYICKNRYNQNLTNGSLIVEIGGDGNTIEESIESTKYLSRAVSEVIKENLET